MGGGTAQLAAQGAADQYLTAHPQVTYFKQIWRRHTQFAMEDIQQSWTGDADFGKKCTINLSKAGDLVTEIWLQVMLPDLVDLNHIVNATAMSSAPVINYARNVSESSVRVDAYTCDNATNYIMHLWNKDNAQIAGLSIDSPGNRLVLTLSFDATATPPVLVPLNSPSTPPISLTGSTVTWSSTALVAGVAYALCFGGDTKSRDNVVMLQASPTGSVSFSPTSLSPAVQYRAKIYTLVASSTLATSSTQEVMKAKWCNSVGHALISSVEWDIGGSRIDRHTGEHYDMWCELAEPEEKRRGYSTMIGRYDTYDINYDAMSSGGSRTLYVPMRFSFNSSPGNALPLLALQFHDCSLNFDFRQFAELIKTNVSVSAELPMRECKVFARYIFLSQDERQRFATMPHEYLIEQVQSQLENIAGSSNPDGVVNRKVALTLSHPVKEIVFAFHAASNLARDSVSGNNWFEYDIPGREGEEIFEEANIQMNGHDRFVKRPALYWRLCQPYQHHTRCPTKHVYTYSFSLHPEQWQNPSGAANFSRIDAAHLALKLNPNIPAGRLRVHALSYNVLRIANGMGGLRFAS